MAELTLYHAIPSRSSIVRWMLEEIGEPYDLEILDLKGGESHTPAYLAINPMGKVPALRHGEAIVTEAAAICLYLADTFPRAGLSVPLGDPRRGAFLTWMFFTSGCLEPALTDRAFKRIEPPPRGTLGYGDWDTTLAVVERAVDPGPYLLGESFSAADVVLGATLRWGMLFGLVPERPSLKAYAARLEERPAFRRAQQKDEAAKAA